MHLYLSPTRNAVVAKRFDPGLRAFGETLRARGKPPKVVTVAVMRVNGLASGHDHGDPHDQP